MGMSVGGGGMRKVKADINITPLVDVVLVLLIIFMVLVPIMMRQVVLEVPRKIDDNEVVTPDQAKVLQVKVQGVEGQTLVFNDGDNETSIPATELVNKLKPLLDAKKTEKVVFVDFEDNVSWKAVITTMDRIRGLATARNDKGDFNWDEIKVALKVREETDESGASQ
jgi:biopolymer transport protein TolR